MKNPSVNQLKKDPITEINIVQRFRKAGHGLFEQICNPVEDPHHAAPEETKQAKHENPCATHQKDHLTDEGWGGVTEKKEREC